jgi:hypothetical protein
LEGPQLDLDVAVTAVRGLKAGEEDGIGLGSEFVGHVGAGVDADERHVLEGEKRGPVDPGRAGIDEDGALIGDIGEETLGRRVEAPGAVDAEGDLAGVSCPRAGWAPATR